MSKSTPKGTTAREVKTPQKKQQFTVILTAPLARALHVLAERDGLPAAALFRAWIREKYEQKFGKEVA